MRKEFIDAVNNHEIHKVRMMLASELILEPSGKSFDEMLKYARTRLPELMEKDNGSTPDFPSDKNLWTQVHVSKMKHILNMNFSEEKLMKYKEMAQKVYQPDIDKSHENPKKCCETFTYMSESQNVNIAVGIAGGATTVAGFILGKTALAFVGGAAIGVAGVNLLYKSLKDKDKK